MRRADAQRAADRAAETPGRKGGARRTLRRAAARRAILDATAELLLEGGPDAVSMRRLADRCGYTAPTIYHYFGDKPGLIDAVLEERFAKLLRHLRRVGRSDDPEQDLRALAAAFARFALRHPAHYQLLAARRTDGGEPPRSAEEARATLEAPLRELEAVGRLALPDVEATGQALWAVLHGMISLRTTRPDYPWVPDGVALTLDAMLRGLVRPGPRRRRSGGSR